MADDHLGQMFERGLVGEPAPEKAFEAYQRASRAMASAKANIAVMLDVGVGVAQDREAAAELFKELSALPDAYGLNGVAWALVTSPNSNTGHYETALSLAQRAVDLDDDPSYVDTLASAKAALGDFDQAVALLETALQNVDEIPLRNEMRDHLASFKNEKAIDGSYAVVDDPLPPPDVPTTRTVFVGEIVRLFERRQRERGIDLEPGHSPFGLTIVVQKTEEGVLPHHLTETANYFLHSPTQFFARLPVQVPVLSYPEGPFRFTLTSSELSYSLSIAPIE